MSYSSSRLTPAQLLEKVLSVANLLCGSSEADKPSVQAAGEIISNQADPVKIAKTRSVRFEVK